MHRVISLVLLTALAIVGASSREATAQKASPSPALQAATATVVIHSDAATFLVDQETIGPLVSDTGAGYLPLPGGSPGNIAGRLMVQLPKPKEPGEAKKTLAAAREHLENVLVKLAKPGMERFDAQVDQAHRHLAEAENQMEQFRVQLQSVRDKLLSLGISPEGSSDQVRSLSEEQLKLRVDVAGLEARQQVILQEIDKVQVKVSDVEKQQETVILELTSVVKVREKQLARIHEFARATPGALSRAEIEQAEAELALAKAELADRRARLAQQAGGDQLSRLNQQLADVQIEKAAALSRTKVIQDSLVRHQSKEARALVDSYDTISRRLQSALAEQELAAKNAAEVKRKRATLRLPEVIVISEE